MTLHVRLTALVFLAIGAVAAEAQQCSERAPAPCARSRAPHTRAVLRRDTSLHGEGDRLTVTYDRMPLRDVVREMSALTRARIVVSTAVETTPVTGRIVDEPWLKGLRRVLQAYRLDVVLLAGGVWTIRSTAELRGIPPAVVSAGLP